MRRVGARLCTKRNVHSDTHATLQYNFAWSTTLPKVLTWHAFIHQAASLLFSHDYFAPRRDAKHCDERVRLSVCLSVHSHISKTTQRNFTNCFVLVACACEERRCDVMYFRFCGWRQIFTYWALWRVMCMLNNPVARLRLNLVIIENWQSSAVISALLG